MKRNLIATILALSSLTAAGHVMASDGTVHFRGEITDAGCTIDTGDADKYVDMGRVARTKLDNVGVMSDPTEFTIALTNCPATYTKVAMKFDGESDPASDGDLKIGSAGAPGAAAAPVNDATHPSGDYTGSGAAIAATGVAIRISNPSGTQVKLYNESEPVTVAADGSANLKFIARYIATTKTVTAGTANADSQFTITYTK
ncbi:MAG: fimbrial protein [Acinetobacter sp.]